MLNLFAAATPDEIRAFGIVITVIVTLLVLFVTFRLYRRARENEAENARQLRINNAVRENEQNAQNESRSDDEQTSESEREIVDDEQNNDEKAAGEIDGSDVESETNDEEPVEDRAEEAVETPVAEGSETEQKEDKSDVSAAEEQAEEQPTEQDVAEEEQAAVAAVTEDTEGDAEETAIADEYPMFIQKYLDDLDGQERDAFERVVLQNEEDLKTRIKLPVSQYEDEKAFVADYFRSCSKLAKRMPIAVTEMLYKRNSEFTATDKDRSRAMRKMIAAYYSRRKEEDTLGRCESLCKEDTDYYIQTVGLREKTLPPLKKLVVMCVSQNRFDEALSWCDVAINNDIIDAKGIGYEGRKDKILIKKEKFETRQAKKEKASKKEGK